MPQINTVRGAVAASKLGVALMHEHIIVLSTEVMQNFPEEHYLHIHNDVIPALKARGVTDEQLNTIDIIGIDCWRGTGSVSDLGPACKSILVEARGRTRSPYRTVVRSIPDNL